MVEVALEAVMGEIAVLDAVVAFSVRVAVPMTMLVVMSGPDG